MLYFRILYSHLFIFINIGTNIAWKGDESLLILHHRKVYGLRSHSLPLEKEFEKHGR